MPSLSFFSHPLLPFWLFFNLIYHLFHQLKLLWELSILHSNSLCCFLKYSSFWLLPSHLYFFRFISSFFHQIQDSLLSTFRYQSEKSPRCLCSKHSSLFVFPSHINWSISIFGQRSWCRDRNTEVVSRCLPQVFRKGCTR